MILFFRRSRIQRSLRRTTPVSTVRVLRPTLERTRLKVIVVERYPIRPEALAVMTDSRPLTALPTRQERGGGGEAVRYQQ